ncbi:STAS domain-containing protein [Ilumatobacter sp.]|uniref:STAS domain-containing protein n=1 Tax=Ilumatobacter sp. TaxID=1967498 RepID=UPI003B51A419
MRSSRSAEGVDGGAPLPWRSVRLRGVRPGGPSWGSLRFDGEIDAGSVALVRASCLDLADGCDVVEIDLGRVTVFTAAGTRLLDHLSRRVERRGGVRARGAAGPIVDRVLRVLRSDDLWPTCRGVLHDPMVEEPSGCEVGP